MKALALSALALLSISMVAGCGGTDSKLPQDPGVTGNGEGAASDVNPDGVPYPTDNLGTSPRIGNRAGSKISNYKFVGYPNGDKSKGLQPISLANFYDPTGKNYKLIHIQAAGVWCTFCQRETEVVVPLAKSLTDRKVVWLVSLAEGPSPGTPSKPSDLDGWISEFQSPYTHVLDPGNKNLGPFYDAAALPWNANINAQTMEILQAGTGAHVTSKDLLDEIDGWLAQIDGGQLK